MRMNETQLIDNPVKTKEINTKRRKTGGRRTRDGIPHQYREVCYSEDCTMVLTKDRHEGAISAGLCLDCWADYNKKQYHARQDVVTDRPLTDSEYNELIANKARRLSQLDTGGDDKLYAIMQERGIIQPDEDKKNLTLDDKIKLIKQIAPEINEALLRLALKMRINPPTVD